MVTILTYNPKQLSERYTVTDFITILNRNNIIHKVNKINKTTSTIEVQEIDEQLAKNFYNKLKNKSYEKPHH